VKTTKLEDLGTAEPFGSGSGKPLAAARREAGRPGGTERRRGNAMQGRALEALGHAVEYLMDSRMFLVGQENGKAEQDALKILMQMSRTVFLECPEVVSVWDKMGRLCRRSFARRTADRGVVR
jgi:hypothetical protein